MRLMTPDAAAEWKAGWPLVLSCFVGFSFLSLMTGSLTVFIEPVGDEFGWSRTLVAAGFSISAVITALLSPPIGVLVDRYGSRRIAIPGIIATSLAIAAFALADGSAAQWFGLWVIYAVISISVKTTVWTSAVAAKFTAGQGLALGVTLSGTAAAQAMLPPLATWLIQEFGWRAAYAWLGLGWGGVTLILCWLFLFTAHDGRRSAGTAKEGGEGARPDFPGLTIAQAWRDLSLWRIVISTLVIMLVTLGLSIHIMPILAEAGVTRTQAAWLITLAGLAGVAGKLVTGVLLDRFRANWVGGVTLGCTALAFALLVDGVHTPALIVFAMIVNGYTQGAKLQINGYLTARYAGMRNFGAIYGFMNAVIAFGSGAGPLVAGLAYDLSGSYGPFLVAGAICSVVCGLLLISLPAYPDFSRRVASPA